MTWLTVGKDIAVLVYFFLTPYLIAPKWCMDYVRTKDEPIGWGAIDCDEAADSMGMPYSGIKSLSPLDTGVMDLICISILLFHQLYKHSFRQSVSASKKCRTIAIFVVGLASLISSALAIVNRTFPRAVNICRPVIMVLFNSGLRKTLKQVSWSLIDTSMILLSMMAFMCIYTLLGFSIFRADNQGLTTFPSLNATLYQLIVLMTTCNFPDVMLPAYNVNFWNSLYFISFLALGMYLILNLLLANVFSVY